ncbi:hypothetical protein BH11ARM2_BH11ARM2_20750 [soil metagenome]
MIAGVVVPLLDALPLHSAWPPLLWIFLVLAYALLGATIIAHEKRHMGLNQTLGYLLSSLFTFFTVVALGKLVYELVHLHGHKMEGGELLTWAALLWVSNILVFALWYWRLDAGGPNARDHRIHHRCGEFLFPQMTMDEAMLGGPWRPGFVDYLFLAFNTSTALSPADTAALGRYAKLAMMAQALISLTIIVLIAARGVNIL